MMTYIYSLFARTNFEGVTRDLNHALTENVFTCFPAINLFGNIKYTDKILLDFCKKYNRNIKIQRKVCA